jgi:hypothetical protein
MRCLLLSKEIKSNAVPKPNLTHNPIRKGISYSIRNFTRSSHICNIKLLILILYVAVVSVYTACLSLKNDYMLPTSCFRVFCMISAKSADRICNSINWWVIKMERQRVACKEGIKFLCISYVSFRLQKANTLNCSYPH